MSAGYTPTTDEMRRFYSFTAPDGRTHGTERYAAEFDRWLAEVKAEVLRDAAEDLSDLSLAIVSNSSDEGHALTAAIVDRCKEAVIGRIEAL